MLKFLKKLFSNSGMSSELVRGPEPKQVQTDHQKRIEDFMRCCEQDVPLTPTYPPMDIRILRARLVMEEAFELVDAMGLNVMCQQTRSCSHPLLDPDSRLRHLVFKDLSFEEKKYLNGFILLDEVAKEAADLSVVTIGTLSAFGIKDQPILEAVDQNNMEKRGPGGHKDPTTGKWIKPPNHKKPDITQLIADQMTEQIKNDD